MKSKTKEIIMYLIFGVLTTLVSWGTYVLFANPLGLGVFVSNLLSWICAVIFAFFTNKLWVFDSKSFEAKTFLKEATTFVASRGITGVFEIVFVPLISKIGFDNLFYPLFKSAGITLKVLYTDGIYSKIAVAVIVVILNYVFSKLFVFKKKEF